MNTNPCFKIPWGSENGSWHQLKDFYTTALGFTLLWSSPPLGMLTCRLECVVCALPKSRWNIGGQETLGWIPQICSASGGTSFWCKEQKKVPLASKEGCFCCRNVGPKPVFSDNTLLSVKITSSLKRHLYLFTGYK